MGKESIVSLELANLAVLQAEQLRGLPAFRTLVSRVPLEETTTTLEGEVLPLNRLIVSHEKEKGRNYA